MTGPFSSMTYGVELTSFKSSNDSFVEVEVYEQLVDDKNDDEVGFQFFSTVLCPNMADCPRPILTTCLVNSFQFYSDVSSSHPHSLPPVFTVYFMP